MRKDEYIVCAAIWINDGKEYMHQPFNIKTGLVFCALRHGPVFVLMEKAYPMGTIDPEIRAGRDAGFLTSYNRFVDREEANTIAIAAKQVDHTKDKDLFSEDLY